MSPQQKKSSPRGMLASPPESPRDTRIRPTVSWSSGTTREREKIVERVPKGTCLHPLLDDYFPYYHHSSLQHGTGFVAGLARPGPQERSHQPRAKAKDPEEAWREHTPVRAERKGLRTWVLCTETSFTLQSGNCVLGAQLRGGHPPPLNQRAGGGICRRRLGDRDQ